ncbi:MAG: hypothetical protein WCR83_05385 [Candidatus Methanomethylophilaceae archaeon]
MANRPILITILGALFLIAAVVYIALGIAGILDLYDISDMGADYNTISTSAVGLTELAIGIIYLIIGYGFIMGWKIMWYLAVIFTALGVIVSIPLMIVLIGIVTLIIYALILYYLFRPGVKEFFGVEKA